MQFGRMQMRRAARTDQNQSEIVQALRAIRGVRVQSLAGVGQGCPDLLVGYRGRNYLLEVKDGQKVKSQRLLTRDEIEWHVSWTGQVRVVETVDEAISEIQRTSKP